MAISSRRALGLYSTAGCLLIAAACVLVNLLSFRYHVRLDFTENKIYSLSDASKKILAPGADTVPLRIRVFFDENLPPEYAHQRRYLSELLGEMSAAGRGRVKVEFADMKKPESKEEAMRAGIAPLRFTAVRQDKFEVQEGMMGLAIYHGDKKEILPAVTQVGNIEYELASRIVKLTQPRSPVVGWSAGNGEMDPPQSLMSYLSQHFDLRRLSTLDRAGWGQEGFSDLSALVIPGPRQRFSDTAVRAIDRAILSGVPTALLLDLYDINMGNFFARKNESGLEKLLASYGLGVKEGLVVDAQNMPVQVQTQQGFFTVQTLVNYPYLPRILRDNAGLSQDHPVTRGLPEIVLPFVSALDLLDSTGVTVLARSSNESFRIAQPFIVSPMQEVRIEGSEKGPFVLGVSIQGRRRSAYADTVPAADPAEGLVRLIVLANANFLDEGRGVSPSNLSFTANLVDWLAATNDLISIRSKTNTYRPLQKVSDTKRNFIKASNLFLMPVVIAFLGLARWQMRRLRRRKWES